MSDPLLLVPAPQEVELRTGHYLLPQHPLIYLAGPAHQLYTIGEHLIERLKQMGLAPTLTAADRIPPDITLRLDSVSLPQAQSYRILIDRSGVTLIGGDAAGLFYAVATLVQLVRLAQGDGQTPLPHAHILDWPDFPQRGVLLDVTRNKVPTQETLFDLVELLASLKINQLQLYTEHTFAYQGHEEVWKDASPLTGEDILALDAHCRTHFIELVPNQNSFGHMHRWLKHDRYRALAEVPEGWIHPFQPEPEPYGLAPTHPDSLALLADLYDQLLPHFSSRQFNPCLDETFDLGMGQSKQLCGEKGVERVYLAFVLQIYELIKRHGRTMQMWGDIIIKQPDLIAELPKDAILLEWGYEADHPFAEHGRHFADAGLSFYVCPGTSSWNTLAGRTDNAIGNLRNAALSGKQHGAIGYLNTDWGDNGHMQPLPVSYLGYTAGAAYSWNVASAADEAGLDIAALLDRHVLLDKAGVMGQLLYDLGNAYCQAGENPRNSSILFWQFLLPSVDVESGDEQRMLRDKRYFEAIRRMTAQADFAAAAAYVDEVVAKLAQAQPARPDAPLLSDEVRWVADMLRFAARLGQARTQRGGAKSLSDLPAEQRRTLADELRPLIARYRQVWLARNRPGGLEESQRMLDTVLAQLSA